MTAIIIALIITAILIDWRRRVWKRRVKMIRADYKIQSRHLESIRDAGAYWMRQAQEQKADWPEMIE